MDLPHDQQAVGHSDADVLLHALTDALLGALALGDIGTLFPNDDPANRDRDSADFVEEALRQVTVAGYQIGNVDCIVFAQQPKLAPHREAIRTRLATLLHVNKDLISLKAKTGESVGPVGRQESVEAQVIALLETTD